ncbi:hypothetical protein [Halorussus salinisoli]|uniref:hypothetical protein n=1 Tax=Halorussus salinisoli TaxID=2558242 RepID=UPI0010C23D8D|nr:hypothetical protein [Halorussus salinisoli]
MVVVVLELGIVFILLEDICLVAPVGTVLWRAVDSTLVSMSSRRDEYPLRRTAASSCVDSVAAGC